MNLDSLLPRWWSPLPLFSGFTVSGADAPQFLQGQLTNDVIALTTTRSQRSGYCTPKGRLMATFLQWRIAEDTIGQILPSALLERTTKRLKMFVLRSKATFSGPESTLAVSGLWFDSPAPSGLGATSGDVTLVTGLDEGQAWLIREPDDALGARAWLIADRVAMGKIESRLQACADRRVSQEAWLLAEIQSGKPWVWSQTVEAFVPQMINFELVDGVSFKKGCYPGQEVVARSQYLGKLKRRTFHGSTQLSDHDLNLLFGSRSVEGGHPLALLIGAEVWSPSDTTQPVGQVVDAARVATPTSASDNQKVHLLIEATLEAWSAGGLMLGSLAPSSPLLSQESLPYSLTTPE